MIVNNGSIAEDSYPVAIMFIWGGKNERRLGLG